MWIAFQVPVVRRKPWGILCLVLNILPLPFGFGTMLAGARDDHITHFMMGISQLALVILGLVLAVTIPSQAGVYVALTFFLLGAVWSIFLGVRIFVKSTHDEPSSSPRTHKGGQAA